MIIVSDPELPNKPGSDIYLSKSFKQTSIAEK